MAPRRDARSRSPAPVVKRPPSSNPGLGPPAQARRAGAGASGADSAQKLPLQFDVGRRADGVEVRRRDAIEASTSTQAPPVNAWAAPPGLQLAPAPDPRRPTPGRRRLIREDRRRALVHKDSGSSNPQVRRFRAAAPRNGDGARKRPVVAPSVGHGPQKKQPVRGPPLLDGPPGVDQALGTHDQSGKKTCIAHGMKFRKLPAPDGGVLSRRPQTYCTGRWTGRRQRRPTRPKAESS